MSAPGPTTPPGWYPDPQIPGMQRWWDGARWTEQTAPLGPSPAAARVPMTPQQARQWAMVAHLSALGALIIGLNWLGPLIVYLVKKDDDQFVADQAREALNFNLSVFLYAVVLGIATLVLLLVIIGVLLIPVLVALGIAWIVLVIVAGLKANDGVPYRYPLTIRFVT